MTVMCRSGSNLNFNEDLDRSAKKAVGEDVPDAKDEADQLTERTLSDACLDAWIN